MRKRERERDRKIEIEQGAKKRLKTTDGKDYRLLHSFFFIFFFFYICCSMNDDEEEDGTVGCFCEILCLN